MRLLENILEPVAVALAVMACAMAVQSCSGMHDEPDVFPGSSEVETVFTLTVSDTSVSSRAPLVPSGGYDRGEGYENYIDVNGYDFRFYFFDENNRFVAPLEVAHVIPVETTASSKKYVVHSFAMKSAITEKVKIVALANWPSYPDDESLVSGTTTIDDIVSRQYAFDTSSMYISADRPIPLYGVTDLLSLDYDDDNRAEIGTIHLLRAYAKVEVLLSENSVFPIEWVKLSRYNSRGYCAPSGIYAQSDYVYDDYDKDYTHTPSIPAGSEVAGVLPFIKADEAGTRWIAYVPEYRNVGRSDDERSTILIKFSGADTDVDRVYFATYDHTASPSVPQNHFDILRNVWYRFTVNRKSPPLVQVVPYNEVDLEPLFGLFIGREYVPIYEEDGSIRYWYDRNTGKYFGPDKITEIEDPYLTVDPHTGWTIIRDLNDRVIGYFDPGSGQYYDRNRNEVPYLDIDASTGWEILRDNDGNVIGYYDRLNDRYYDVDKKTEKPSLG